MKLFFLHLKEEWDRKYVFIIFLCEVILLVGYHAMKFDKVYYLQELQGTLITTVIVFICQMLLTYELFVDFQRNEWKELLRLSKHGWFRVAASKGIIVSLFIIIEFLAVLLVELLKIHLVGYTDILLESLIRVILLDYVLLPAVGASLGIACAFCAKKRWTGYIWLLVLGVLGCGLFERINTALYLTMDINLDKILVLLQFKQPNTKWVVDILYHVPVERYRILVYCGWILGSFALVFAVCFRKKTRRVISGGVCGVLCVLACVLAIQNDNFVNYDMNKGAAGTSLEFEADEERIEKTPDFSVEQCSMNLCITDQLYADVILTLRDNSQNTYEFTLYRGYEITKVVDESGNLLSYERDGDFITIDSESTLSEVHISYHGFNPVFYSNRQGIMLPGYFAYYPQAGHRKVYLDYKKDLARYYGYNTSEELLYETEYDIAVEYAEGIVCSNLDCDSGIFRGNTNVPTLLGGRVSEQWAKDIHIVYPTLLSVPEEFPDDLKNALIEYSKCLGMEDDNVQSLKHIFFVPATASVNNMWGVDIMADDCLFLLGLEGQDYDAESAAIQIIRQNLNVSGDKNFLSNSMLDILYGATYCEELIPMNIEEFFSITYDKDNTETEAFEYILGTNAFERMYLTLLDAYDDEVVYKETVSYLLDDTASENCAEFMQNLYRELEEGA